MVSSSSWTRELMLSSLCFTTHRSVIPLRGSCVHCQDVHELHGLRLRADISPTCTSLIPGDTFIFLVGAILALSKKSLKAVLGTGSSLGSVGFWMPLCRWDSDPPFTVFLSGSRAGAGGRGGTTPPPAMPKQSL